MPGVMVGMDQRDSNYDTSWLSEDFQIDPIIDEPVDTLVLGAKDDTWNFLGMAGFPICMEAPEEQRKKRRVGGGAPCESRKTVTLILFYVLFFFCTPLLTGERCRCSWCT